VNPSDVYARSMGDPGIPVPFPPLILGGDGSGVVASVGSESSLFSPGDEVYWARDPTRPGTYAELTTVDERLVGRKPANLSFAEAAALPSTGITAWESLLENLGAPAPAGEGVGGIALIVGGAGGVGSIAIQIAKEVCGLEVVATASRAESRAWCEAMGAHHVIDHREGFLGQFRVHAIGEANYVLMASDLSLFPQVLGVLAYMGKICSVNGGDAQRCLDVSGLFAKRGSFSGELRYSRIWMDQEPERHGQILGELASLVEAGRIKSTMSRSIDWRDFRVAQAAIESHHTVGKLVMEITD